MVNMACIWNKYRFWSNVREETFPSVLPLPQINATNSLMSLKPSLSDHSAQCCIWYELCCSKSNTWFKIGLRWFCFILRPHFKEPLKTQNSLWRWPWTPHPPASTFQVLRLRMIDNLVLNYSLTGFYLAHSPYERKVGSMEEERTFLMLNASVFIYKYWTDRWKVAWGTGLLLDLST